MQENEGPESGFLCGLGASPGRRRDGQQSIATHTAWRVLEQCMFCFMSRYARPDLGQDDLTMMLAQSERVGTRLFGGQTLPPAEA